MNALTKFFGGLTSNVEQNKVEDYYGHGTQNHSHHADHQTVKYQCPMKCEGDKTYDQPGNCPVCNMRLVQVDIRHHHD